MVGGGSDTSHNYVFIMSLLPDSPATSCGELRVMDQLLKVGDVCVADMTRAEAQKVIDKAPEKVTIMLMRLSSPSPSPLINGNRSKSGSFSGLHRSRSGSYSDTYSSFPSECSFPFLVSKRKLTIQFVTLNIIVLCNGSPLPHNTYV